MNRGRVVVRLALASVAVALPLLLLFGLRPRWVARLPTTLPAQWGAQGVGGVMDESRMFEISVGISMLGTVCALLAIALVRASLLGRRWAAAVFSSIAAVAATSWIANASSALDASSPYETHPGPGVALVMVAMVYGALPALLIPPPAQTKGFPRRDWH